jgi:hypothetical protein
MSDVPGSAPPAGNPPVDGGGNPPATPPAAPPASDAKWYSGIQDDTLRGLAELKGWDSPDKALTSYRNLEKLTGVPPERIAKIPDAEDKAGWSEFNKKFGWTAPEDAKEYNIEVPAGSDTRYADYIRGVFKDAGVPKEMAEKLAKANNSFMAELIKSEEDAYNVKAQADMSALKAEWGGEFDKLDQLGRRSAKEFGVDQATMEAMEDVMGPAGVARFWAKIGGKIGEAAFVDGKVDSLGPMTPDAAKARVHQLGSDKEWFARLTAGGVKEKQEWQQLQSIIANSANR